MGRARTERREGRRNPEPRLVHGSGRGPGRPRIREEGEAFYTAQRKWLVYKVMKALAEREWARLCRAGVSDQVARRQVIRWARAQERRLARASFCDLVRLYREVGQREG